MNESIKPGQKAPEFTLKSTPDQKVSLSELRGKHVVLLFYPADFSPGCGDELTIFNEAKSLFEQQNAQIVGISVDNVWSHNAFAKLKNLHIPLLADFHPKGAVSKLYNAYSEKEGTSKRVIVLIDHEGIIRWRYQAPVGIAPGVDEVLGELKNLN